MRTVEEYKYELVSLLEEQGFEGTDKILEISLFEYRMVFNPKTNILIYSFFSDVEFSENFEDFSFVVIRIDESDINELFEQYKEGILNFVGIDESEWLSMNLISKISDVHFYCGLSQLYNESPYDLEEIIDWLKMMK